MKNVGYIFITVGFLVGALTTVVDVAVVPWGYFSFGLLVGVAGVALVHLAERRLVRAEGSTTLGLKPLADSLDRIVANAGRLVEERRPDDPYALHVRIDELFPEDVAAFVAGRENIAHVHGLQAYADVMSHFAAGERYLNRVWSSSADGYTDEVAEYLERAEGQFSLARERFRALGALPE